MHVSNHGVFADLLSSGVRSKVLKGQRTYRLFAGVFALVVVSTAFYHTIIVAAVDLSSCAFDYKHELTVTH